MKKHASPAKTVRSYRRLINFLLKKTPKLSVKCHPRIDISPQARILSHFKLASHSVMPKIKILSRNKQVATDILPDSQQVLQNQNQELVSKVEQIQIELYETENGFRELIKLINEHIQILTEELKDLPAKILSQIQQLQPP